MTSFGERIIAVLALAAVVFVGLAATGTLPLPVTTAGATGEYCQYGTDQYGNCKPPAPCEYGGQYGTDQYGNCNPPPIVDTTKPTIGVVQSPPPNANGWNRTSVTLTFTASDNAGGSGVASITCAGITTSGATRVFVIAVNTIRTTTCTATDKAGNVSNPASIITRIDLTAPSVAFAGQVPLPNANGWNNTDVTVNFTCSDALSGPTAFTGSRLVSTESAAPVSGTCTDLAGNSTTAVLTVVRLDKTAPVITPFGRTPPANLNGWNNSDVTLSWTCTDGISGVAVPFVTRTITTEGAGQTATATCTDLAGNSSVPQTQTGVNIDKTPPTITLLDRTLPPAGSIWNTGDVTLDWGCADGLSGPVSPIVTVVVDTDGANQSATGTCVDQAGNTSTDTQTQINIDRTPPQIDFQGQDPPPAVPNGWNNTNVTLKWACVDPISDVVDSFVSKTLTGEGAGQSATGTCVNNAGLSSHDTQSGVAIDKRRRRPPSPVADRVPEFLGDGGWFKDSATVSFVGNGDPNGANGTLGSGVDPAATTPPVTFTDNGSHTAVGVVHDRAGNESPPASLTVQVDASAPVVAAAFENADGTAYVPGTWTNQPVIVTFDCTDGGGSGAFSFSPPTVVSSPGAAQSVLGMCKDNVGHETATSFGDIDIDETPPEAALVFDPATQDLLVFGTDEGGSGISADPFDPSAPPGGKKPPPKDQKTYELVDGAGNTLELVVKIDDGSKTIDAKVISLSYNGGPPITGLNTPLHWDWHLAKDGSLSELNQDLNVGKGHAHEHVTAKFDAKKNQTKITADPGNVKTTATGLVIVQVTTNAGALDLVY